MCYFDSESAFRQARSIAYPRLVGTVGEARAANYIKEQLEQSGYEVSEEDFSISYTPWGFSRLCLVFALILLFISWATYDTHPVLAFVLLLILLLFQPLVTEIWLKLAKREIKGNLFPNLLHSKNIIAGFPNSANNSRHTVCFIAHYDSKSQNISLAMRVFCILYALAAVVMLLMGLGLQFNNFALDIKTNLWFTIIGLALLRLLAVSTRNKSCGGLDNAGSVGVALELAQVFARQPAPGIDIGYLFTGAEEWGLLGASRYVARHSVKCSADNVCFINLDGVGVGGKLALLGKANFKLSKGLTEVARKQGIRLGSRRLLPGLLVDHIPFAKAGFPAVTLACVATRSFLIHTPYDTISLLDKAGLEEVGRLLEIWVRALPKENFSKTSDLSVDILLKI